jgi:hypothetical protein
MAELKCICNKKIDSTNKVMVMVRVLVCCNNICLKWFHSTQCVINFLKTEHNLNFGPTSNIKQIKPNIKCECGSYYRGIQKKNFTTINSLTSIGGYQKLLKQCLDEFILDLAYKKIVPIEIKDFIDYFQETFFRNRLMYMGLNINGMIPYIKNKYKYTNNEYSILADLPDSFIRVHAVLIRQLQFQFWQKVDEFHKWVKVNIFTS